MRAVGITRRDSSHCRLAASCLLAIALVADGACQVSEDRPSTAAAATPAATASGVAAACPDPARAVARVEVIAHRGASTYAPENTMSSFTRAIQQGADWLEFDVQRTKDGRLIVMHDATVDRTTNGRGRIVDLTFDQIRGLDAGAWFGSAFAGERVPTFTEVALLARDAHVRIFPETKNPQLYPGVESQLLAELKATGMDRCAVIQSFDGTSLARVRAAAPTQLLAACFDQVGRFEPPPANAEIICPDYHFVAADPTIVRAAHAAGRKVWVFETDSAPTIRMLAALGVDGIYTNTPDLARTALGPGR